MGGSMYIRRVDTSGDLSLRGRTSAELEAFGPYAARTGTEGIELNGVSVPMGSAAGQAVIAHFVIVSGPGSGAEVSECLVTFKPTRPGPHHAAFLITALAEELTEFARTRVLSDFADTASSITLAQDIPYDLHVDGHRVLGWALFAKGAAGVAVDHRDRVLMWLGAEDRTVIPATIYTSDSGRFVIGARLTSTD
ncbi:hypothetical protein [Arthrobacter sp. QXT-31]|uniref:hypothetical protein n=1 Tax=Arthrobacter sp. QXT-31 TaxID=1357915 RepID=UPI0012FC001B|nr:hypothetical protein [Arthrobacter sp. QXT-31]